MGVGFEPTVNRAATVFKTVYHLTRLLSNPDPLPARHVSATSDFGLTQLAVPDGATGSVPKLRPRVVDVEPHTGPVRVRQ